LNPQERVQRLIALAAADNPTNDPAIENEQRAAAWQAIKLIREHKMLEQPSHGPFQGDPRMQTFGGLGFVGVLLAGIVESGIMKDIDFSAHASSASEIATLRAKVRMLQTENANLRARVETRKRRRRVG
jgi:hypothetical protein